MRKIIGNTLGVCMMFAALIGMGAESFHPKTVTLLLAVPLALLVAIWVRDAIAPFTSSPSSPSFGARDNRGLRTVTLVMMSCVAYPAIVYFAAPLLANVSGTAQYRVGTVNSWDANSRRPFTRRMTGRCTRLSASVKTGDGDLHMSRCIGKRFPIRLGPGSSFLIVTVESPLGTVVTRQILFQPRKMPMP